MRPWQDNLARILVGVVLGTIVGIALLHFGDFEEPAVQPSHIYQPGNPIWTAGIPYWWLAGAGIGVMAGLASFRYRGRLAALSLVAAAGGVLGTTFVAAFQSLAQSHEVTLNNLLIEGGIYTGFFVVLTFLPIFLVVVIMSSLFARERYRSALDIMPDELRHHYEADLAAEHDKPFLQRLLRR